MDFTPELKVQSYTDLKGHIESIMFNVFNDKLREFVDMGGIDDYIKEYEVDNEEDQLKIDYIKQIKKDILPFIGLFEVRLNVEGKNVDV